MNNNQISSGTRLAAMFLDHILMTFIAMIFFIPGMVSMLSEAFKDMSGPRPIFMTGGFLYFSLIGFAIYFCKDCINGRSLAKRILKLQVVDNSTGLAASPLQCLVRDLFCVLWPIEVLVSLSNTSRRIGDRVAGTKLVVFDPTLQQPKINVGQVVLSLVIAYGLMFLLMLPFKVLQSKIDSQRISYFKHSCIDPTIKQNQYIKNFLM